MIVERIEGRAGGYQASHILRSDESVVDAIMDQLVLGVGRVVRDLDRVADDPVTLTIRAILLRDALNGDATQVSGDCNELGDTIYVHSQWGFWPLTLLDCTYFHHCTLVHQCFGDRCKR